MKKEDKKQLITLVSLLFIISVFIFFGFFRINKEDTEIEKNPAYTNAIIIDTYVGAKARDFVKYEFLANGKIFKGDQNYMAHRQAVNIGDTCEVMYAKTNPQISRLLTDENHLLKIKKKKIILLP